MSFCTVKCPICQNWMSRTTSKRGQPVLHCAVCGYAVLILRQKTIDVLDKVCKTISQQDLPPETLEKHRQKQ